MPTRHPAVNCSKSPFIIGVGGCNEKFQQNHYNYLWSTLMNSLKLGCKWTTEYHCIESELFTTLLFCQCLDNLYFIYNYIHGEHGIFEAPHLPLKPASYLYTT